MKNSFTTLILLLIAFSSFSQVSSKTTDDLKSITSFEKYIMSGRKPILTKVETKYENDYRAIIWDEPLIKNYKYSNEAFDKLGYEFVTETEGDDYQSSKTYRSCSKSLIFEVREWYGLKLSISMEWFSPKVKRGIGYLAYCE